jgi:hypothetical protein
MLAVIVFFVVLVVLDRLWVLNHSEAFRGAELPDEIPPWRRDPRGYTPAFLGRPGAARTSRPVFTGRRWRVWDEWLSWEEAGEDRMRTGAGQGRGRKSSAAPARVLGGAEPVRPEILNKAGGAGGAMCGDVLAGRGLPKGMPASVCPAPMRAVTRSFGEPSRLQDTRVSIPCQAPDIRDSGSDAGFPSAGGRLATVSLP